MKCKQGILGFLCLIYFALNSNQLAGADSDSLYLTPASLRQKTLEELEKDSTLRKMDNQFLTAKLRVVLREVTNPNKKNHWLYIILKDQLENYGIKNIDNLLASFRQNCTDSQYLAEIDSLYRKDLARRSNHTIKTYKTVDGFSLDAHIFYPPDFKKGDKRPALVFFHGGSWYCGKVECGFGDCKHYADLGFVTISAEYRVYDRQGVTPVECVTDAKSMIRWMRKNAFELGIDPDKIVASGASAGGHMVACAGIIPGFEEPTEDLKISSVPNAMIFYYSCFDPTLDPWYVKQVQKRTKPENCSPNHNMRSGVPPAIVFHGTLDKMCPFWTAKEFCEKMSKTGNRCELNAFEGAGHFFTFQEKYADEVDRRVEKFLKSLGYLK